MLYSENAVSLLNMINELNTDSVKVGFIINIEKTVIMFTQAALDEDMKIDGHRLSATKLVKYLHQSITQNGYEMVVNIT